MPSKHVALYVTCFTGPPHEASLLMRIPLLLVEVWPNSSVPYIVLFSQRTFVTPSNVWLPIDIPCVPRKTLLLTVTFEQPAWFVLMAMPSSPSSMKEPWTVAFVMLSMSMPSVLWVFAGVAMWMFHAVKPLPPST
jgi:hypothetical protein